MGDLLFSVVLLMENIILLNQKYISVQWKHVIYYSAKVQ